MAAATIPADLRRAVDKIIGEARLRLQAGAELGTVALVDAPSTGSVLAMPMTGPSGREKNEWTRAIRTVSSLADSRFVIVLSEIWLTEVDTREEMNRLVDQYREVRHMPGRREAVFVHLETHDGTWQGEADVEPFHLNAVKGARTFGAVELKMPKFTEGRISGLLASRRPGREG